MSGDHDQGGGTSRDASSPPLAGQHAFITGGGSGIGEAAAAALVRDGALVTLCGRSMARLDGAKSRLGAAAEVVSVDVADEAAMAAAVDAANERAPITIGLASAGVGSAGPLLATEVDAWKAVLDTNLTGAFITFKHVGRHVVANGGGALCAVSSIAGSHTHRFMAAYTASKAGLNMLVRNAADELGALGVRVNAVAPGLVETEISAALQNDAGVDADYRANMPLGRRGTVADTAAAIRFLCGPEASWITGVVLPVDGGHHLRRGPNIDGLLAPFVPDLPPPSADAS